MEKQKSFGEKNEQGSQQTPGQDHTKPKPRKNQTQPVPGGPGERSDEESIGRPVQLDKDQQKRQPGEGRQECRARSESANI